MTSGGVTDDYSTTKAIIKDAFREARAGPTSPEYESTWWRRGPAPLAGSADHRCRAAPLWPRQKESPTFGYPGAGDARGPGHRRPGVSEGDRRSAGDGAAGQPLSGGAQEARTQTERPALAG